MGRARRAGGGLRLPAASSTTSTAGTAAALMTAQALTPARSASTMAWTMAGAAHAAAPATRATDREGGAR